MRDEFDEPQPALETAPVAEVAALESSHALAYAAKLAPTLPKDKVLLVNLSGRGDKDMHTVAERSGIQF